MKTVDPAVMIEALTAFCEAYEEGNDGQKLDLFKRAMPIVIMVRDLLLKQSDDAAALHGMVDVATKHELPVMRQIAAVTINSRLKRLNMSAMR